MSQNFSRAKNACYFSYLSSSSVFSLPPILFVTFRESYGISYTMLGALVLINFCTQLLIDLVFTFFPSRFNIHKTVRLTPLGTSAGLLIYALAPTLFPRFAYAGLVIGTVIFSVSAGLGEVLLSPLVAAVPSDNPERDMSRLHSLYAWGVVMVVVLSSVFLRVFGSAHWALLTVFWALLPLVSFFLFSRAELPEMKLSSDSERSGKSRVPIAGLALCTLFIFLGGASENSMTNWISGFAENALHIPKLEGDILGMALFAVLLGTGRTLYSRFGKNISAVLTAGAIGSALCYIIAAVSGIPAISLAACVLTGFCASMLWPGTLILMDEKLPAVGIAGYALMAAGGDLGSSVAPQLIGIVIDRVSESKLAASLAASLSITPEQLGMKAGMLTGAIFPILALILILVMRRYFSRRKRS